MPAVSKKQQGFFAWAMTHPEQAALEGKATGMSKGQMQDFAATPTKTLPIKTPKVPVKSFGAKMPTVGKRKKYYGEG